MTPVALPAWDQVLAATTPQRVGQVDSVVGLGVQVRGLRCAVGEMVLIGDEPGSPAEVVALDSGMAQCMPLGEIEGLREGAPVRGTGRPATVPVGPALLGRVIDAVGRPIDGKGPIFAADHVSVNALAPNALERARIDTPMSVGVRVLDTLVTLGRGQRIGLFAGSGVGKSTLLSMIARGTTAEVCVIALVGERGREVREFLEDDLGPEGLSRSVVVVATSDETPMLRKRAAFTATRIAEYYRDAGRHAVLMMDSMTRTCMAQREIGLSVGEPPATRGYPPSTFSMMAQLLERAGCGVFGSVTGIYTVLVDGDDHNEPIADQARSILDGHVVLDRKLAVAGHYPSIDALGSVSRVATKVCTPEQKALAAKLRQVMSAKRSVQDLIDVGAYQEGTNPMVDAAVTNDDAIEAFLCQAIGEIPSYDESWEQLDVLLNQIGMGVRAA
ncbi:MAG: FliI/YscN family ATPase [Actinomycetaceae bacterium]|nr:FliI/YscN family ATPase [Actinomycetaceae bacterium]